MNLTIVFEGQEEAGSAFDFYPLERPEPFACDAMVIADVGNIRPGEPTMTIALRGSAAVTVEVETLTDPKHSGQFGGAAPDALLPDPAQARAVEVLQDLWRRTRA